MLWLWYIALWTDLIGLVPGAHPEARLLRVEHRGRALPIAGPPDGAAPDGTVAAEGAPGVRRLAVPVGEGRGPLKGVS